jgi:hypothetical protein
MGPGDPIDILPYEEGGLLVVCLLLVRAVFTNVNNAYKIHIKNIKTNKQFEYELMIALQVNRAANPEVNLLYANTRPVAWTRSTCSAYIYILIG